MKTQGWRISANNAGAVHELDGLDRRFEGFNLESSRLMLSASSYRACKGDEST